MNRRFFGLLLAAAMLFSLTGPLLAQAQPAPAKQYVFPAKGQSPEQQKKDEQGCAQWATEETGFDPARPPVYQAPPPPPPPPKGSALRGAVRGAAAGYIIGDVANNEGGEGAAIGAVVGAAGASSKQKKASQQQSQAVSADRAAFDQKVAAMNQEFSKARSACLEAKGYTVK